MSSLNRIFAGCAEDFRFKTWQSGHKLDERVVYLCEYGTVWKFTPREWWRFVTTVIRNHGAYDLVLSQSLRRRPNYIIRTSDGRFVSTHAGARCVDPRAWTVENWERELA